MPDDTRREFLKTAGIAAAAVAVGGAVAVPSEAAGIKLLPKAQFEQFFGDILALTTDPKQKDVSIGDVLKRHGIELSFPPRIGQELNALLGMKPGVVRARPGVADSDCSACAVCACCVLCGDTNDAASVVNLGAIVSM